MNGVANLLLDNEEHPLQLGKNFKRHPKISFHTIRSFLVRVQRESQESAFRVYEVKINEPLQFTTDSRIEAGQTRRFVVRAACKTRLAAGKEYLLMGRDGETRDSNDRPQYLLDKNSWIEELPDSRRCKATQYRNTCAHLDSFTTSFGINGCRI